MATSVVAALSRCRQSHCYNIINLMMFSLVKTRAEWNTVQGRSDWKTCFPYRLRIMLSDRSRILVRSMFAATTGTPILAAESTSLGYSLLVRTYCRLSRVSCWYLQTIVEGGWEGVQVWSVSGYATACPADPQCLTKGLKEHTNWTKLIAYI